MATLSTACRGRVKQRHKRRRTCLRNPAMNRGRRSERQLDFGSCLTRLNDLLTKIHLRETQKRHDPDASDDSGRLF